MHFSGSSIKITTIARQLGNPAVVSSAKYKHPHFRKPLLLELGREAQRGEGCAHVPMAQMGGAGWQWQPLQVDPLLIHNRTQYVKSPTKGRAFGQIVNK